MPDPQRTAIGTLVFDLDGTLVDSAPDLAGSLDTLLAEAGCEPLGLAATRRLIGHGIPNLVRGGLETRGLFLAPEEAAAAASRFMQIYAGRLSRETRPYADVEAGLRRFATDGWRLAVCTNKAEPYARAILADLGLLSAFAAIAGPDTFGCAKPDPQHLLKTIEAAGTGRPTILIGDSEVDIATAKAAAVPVIAVTYGYAKTDLAELLPDGLATSFKDLYLIVTRLAGAVTPWS